MNGQNATQLDDYDVTHYTCGGCLHYEPDAQTVGGACHVDRAPWPIVRSDSRACRLWTDPQTPLPQALADARTARPECQQYDDDGLRRGLLVVGWRLSLNLNYRKRVEAARMDSDDWQPAGLGTVLAYQIQTAISKVLIDPNGKPWLMRLHVERRLWSVVAADDPREDGVGSDTFTLCCEALDRARPGTTWLPSMVLIAAAGTTTTEQQGSITDKARLADASRALAVKGWEYGSHHLPHIGSRRAYRKPGADRAPAVRLVG